LANCACAERQSRCPLEPVLGGDMIPNHIISQLLSSRKHP
jgi:hypothetical protein